MLPSSVEAKPHCGDRQSWSSGDEFRRLVDAALDLVLAIPSVPDFEVTRPSTTVLPFGTKRSGSKPPARSLSYSMK